MEGQSPKGFLSRVVSPTTPFPLLTMMKPFNSRRHAVCFLKASREVVCLGSNSRSSEQILMIEDAPLDPIRSCKLQRLYAAFSVPVQTCVRPMPEAVLLFHFHFSSRLAEVITPHHYLRTPLNEARIWCSATPMHTFVKVSMQ